MGRYHCMLVDSKYQLQLFLRISASGRLSCKDACVFNFPMKYVHIHWFSFELKNLNKGQEEGGWYKKNSFDSDMDTLLIFNLPQTSCATFNSDSKSISSTVKCP